MARQDDLFGYRKPRVRRGRIAHMVDVGDHGCIYAAGNSCVALFTCKRCGWTSDWLERRNKTHVLQGVPCEACNKPKKEAA
ncbi:hypothetical protein [Acetobacter nitrogenifigens]|uniref:hypothetical protein n=1 Tax=Acetobacter nitrogenifigens TaxID=285268 RepID=UPI00047DC80A|nr:hypothetical protein [Acetobacter nitrogenifigens]